MSDIANRPSRTPRRVREKRANQLVLVGSVSGIVAFVGFLLTAFTSFPGWVPVLAAVIAVACAVMFQRNLKP